MGFVITFFMTLSIVTSSVTLIRNTRLPLSVDYRFFFLKLYTFARWGLFVTSLCTCSFSITGLLLYPKMVGMVKRFGGSSTVSFLFGGLRKPSQRISACSTTLKPKQTPLTGSTLILFGYYGVYTPEHSLLEFFGDIWAYIYYINLKSVKKSNQFMYFTGDRNLKNPFTTHFVQAFERGICRVNTGLTYVENTDIRKDQWRKVELRRWVQKPKLIRPITKKSRSTVNNSTSRVTSPKWESSFKSWVGRLVIAKEVLDSTSTVEKFHRRLKLTPADLKVGKNLIHTLFDINFMKKEKSYTKLKYSRSPAYDIVSGGAAALLSGFIGFLISEKFGIELVDSGDLYIGLMYIVFLSFACRPLLRSLSTLSAGTMHTEWSVFSLNHPLNYTLTIFSLYWHLFALMCKVTKKFLLNTLGSVNTTLLLAILLVVTFTF